MISAGCAPSLSERLRPVAISNACDKNAGPVKVVPEAGVDMRVNAARYAAGVKKANQRLIARRKCEASIRARYSAK